MKQVSTTQFNGLNSRIQFPNEPRFIIQCKRSLFFSNEYNLIQIIDFNGRNHPATVTLFCSAQNCKNTASLSPRITGIQNRLSLLLNFNIFTNKLSKQGS